MKTSFTCTEHYAENCTSNFERLDNGSFTWSMYADLVKPVYENVSVNIFKYNQFIKFNQFKYNYLWIDTHFCIAFQIFFRSYEMKNGQYKKSMLQFDKNFCDFVKSDSWMLKMARGYTNMPKKCPMMVIWFRYVMCIGINKM